MSNVPIGNSGNSGKKDHLGAIATFNTGESTTTIEHKATIGSNITIVTESSLSGINRNSKQQQGAEHSEHSGIMIPIAMGLAKDLFSSKDKPEMYEIVEVNKDNILRGQCLVAIKNGDMHPISLEYLLSYPIGTIEKKEQDNEGKWRYLVDFLDCEVRCTPSVGQ